MAASFVFAGVGLGILSSGVLVPLLLTQGLEVAWAGLAMAGMAGAAIALWGWRQAPEPVRATGDQPSGRLLFGREAVNLLAAHALFSFGIVPHTLYWVDFLVRDQRLGMETGGLHWSIVGVFAILGPLLTAGLARVTGTAMALVLASAVLGLGLAAPFLWPSTLVLVASSVLFGAQPGLSSLMAARARDLGAAETMARFMRAMIIANSCGAFLGGLFFPWAYGLMQGPAPLFLIAGAAMGLAAVSAWPRRSTQPSG